MRSESIFRAFFSACGEKNIVDINQRWKNDFKRVSFTLNTDELQQGHNHITEQQTLTPQMDKSILENGHTEENKLPKVCGNDELVSTSPSPVSVKLNNKLDIEGLIEKTTSPQTSSTLNIADVNTMTESVQSITVKLENLNGIQFTPSNVTYSVRRSSTGSAPC